MTYRLSTFAILSCLIILSGCGGGTKIKETLGVEREAPDEFAVIKRAPLELPPDYNLRPPRPGAERPQELNPSNEARRTIFGTPVPERAQIPTSAEDQFLQALGAENADPDIRRSLDGETSEIRNKNRTVAERLLGREGDIEGSVVNPDDEMERLRETTNNALGNIGTATERANKIIITE